MGCGCIQAPTLCAYSTVLKRTEQKMEVISSFKKIDIENDLAKIYKLTINLAHSYQMHHWNAKILVCDKACKIKRKVPT